jgi:hypothetical protein
VWLAVVLGAALGCGGRSLGGPGAAGVAGAPGAAGMSGVAGTSGAAGGAPDGGAPAVDAGPASGAVATRPNGSCVSGAFKRMGTGPCTCQEITPSVCGDACTNLSNDNANCGACGHACAATSVCNEGVCGPEATNVMPAIPGCTRLDLAITGGNLYWTDQEHGTIGRRTLAGGAATTLVSGAKAPSHLVIGGSSLFWLEVVATKPVEMPGFYMPTLTTAAVRKAGLDGSAPTTLATETNPWSGIRGLAVSDDARTVYYSAETKIRAVPAAGGAPFDVGSEDHGGIPVGLGVGGSYIGYITDLNGQVDVISVAEDTVARCGGVDPTDMTGEKLLMVNCVRIGGCTPDALMDRFIVRGMNAYWSDGNTLFTGPVQSDSPARANKESIANGLAENGGAFSGLVDAPDALYFAQPGWDGKNGLIQRTSYERSSTAVALIRGQNGPRSLAVDGAKVYWSTADCAIYSSPR